jgi:hypothetical protein
VRVLVNFIDVVDDHLLIELANAERLSSLFPVVSKVCKSLSFFLYADIRVRSTAFFGLRVVTREAPRAFPASQADTSKELIVKICRYEVKQPSLEFPEVLALNPAQLEYINSTA